MSKIYQINIHDSSDNLFAFYSTKNKNEVDRLIKKFLRVKGVSVEVKIQDILLLIQKQEP